MAFFHLAISLYFFSFLVPWNLTWIWSVDYELLQLSASFQGPHVLHVVGRVSTKPLCTIEKGAWQGSHSRHSSVGSGAAEGTRKREGFLPLHRLPHWGQPFAEACAGWIQAWCPRGPAPCAGHSLPGMYGCSEDRQGKSLCPVSAAPVAREATRAPGFRPVVSHWYLSGSWMREHREKCVCIKT